MNAALCPLLPSSPVAVRSVTGPDKAALMSTYAAIENEGSIGVEKVGDIGEAEITEAAGNCMMCFAMMVGCVFGSWVGV